MSELEDKQLRIILKELRKSKLNKYKDLLSRAEPRLEKIFYNHNAFIKNLGLKELDDRLNDLEWMSKKEEIATSSYEPPLIIDGGINYSIDNNQQGYRPGSIIKLGYDAKSKIVNTKDGKPIILDIKAQKDGEQKSKRFIIKKGDGLFIDDFKFKKVDKDDGGGDGGDDRDWSRMGYDDILNKFNAIEQETEKLPQTNQVSIYSTKEGIFQSSGGVTAATVRNTNVFGSSFRTTNDETVQSLSEKTDVSLNEKTDVSLDETVGDYETVEEGIINDILNFINNGSLDIDRLTPDIKKQYKDFLERNSVDTPLIYYFMMFAEDGSLDKFKEILEESGNKNIYVEKFTNDLIKDFRELLQGYESVSGGEDSKFFKHYLKRLEKIKKINVDDRNQEWIENVLNGILLFADYRQLRHRNNGKTIDENDFEKKGTGAVEIVSPKKGNKLKIQKKKRNIANKIKNGNNKVINIEEEKGFVSMTDLFEKLLAAGEINHNEPQDHRRDFNDAINTNNDKEKLEAYLKLFAYAYGKKPDRRKQPKDQSDSENFKNILNSIDTTKIPSNIATSKVGEELYFIDMSKKNNEGLPIAVIKLGILRERLIEEEEAQNGGGQSVPQTPDFSSPYVKKTKSRIQGQKFKDTTDIHQFVKDMGLMPKYIINSPKLKLNKKNTKEEIILYDILDENDDQNVPVFV